MGFLGLLLYVIFATNYYASSLGMHSEPRLSLIVNDGSKIIMESNDSWYFPQSGVNLQVPIPTKEALPQLKKYLLQHPQKHLIITGLYLDREKNFSGHENLGDARAEALFNYLRDLGFPEERMKLSSDEVVNLKTIGNRVYGAIMLDFPELLEFGEY